MPCNAQRPMASIIGRCSHCGRGGQVGERVNLEIAPTDVERWALIGNTGSGKSELLKMLIAAWLAAGIPVVCFDVDDEMSRHGVDDPRASRGPLRDKCTVREFLADPDRWINRADVSLAIVPEDPEEDAEHVARQFVAVAKWIKARGMTGRQSGLPALVLVIEEVGYFANPDKAPQAMAAAIRKLRGIMVKWRKKGVAVVLVAQYPSQIDSGVRTQVSRFVCFQVTKGSQRNTLAIDTGKPFADALKDLAEREYSVRDLRGRMREDLAPPPLRGPHRASSTDPRSSRRKKEGAS
jgi:energy-coupling factor transporter ATP-binding protein EcfA2